MYGYNYYQPNPQQQPNQDERIWVQNETAAEAYLVAPNSFVRLWNANENKFYEKRADATGRPLPMECYRYSKIPNMTVTSEENKNDIQEQLTAIMSRLDRLEEVVNNEQSINDATEIQRVQENIPG